MIPHHCSDVAVKDVTFPLEEGRILDEVRRWKVYRGTAYIVLRNGSDLAILEVPAAGKGLLKQVTSVRVLALPELVGYVEDAAADTLNHRSMAKAAAGDPHPFVVVQGEFGHLSFIHKRPGLRLRVLDVVPPGPAKLVTMVHRALEFLPHEAEVLVEPAVTDLESWGGGATTSTVMYPCRISLPQDQGRRVLFLDDAPALLGAPDEDRPPQRPGGTAPLPADVTLIGCPLSRKIFLASYKRPPGTFRDFCPTAVLASMAPTAPGERRIARCCDLEEEVRLEGTTCLVPWGTTSVQVVEALQKLLAAPDG